MMGESGGCLLGAGRRADQDAVVAGQMLMQKSGGFPSLFDTLRGEFACMVGCAIFRFRMPPQDQIHLASEYYILFIGIYRIHYLSHFNTKGMI
jgi:hypothetical protein